MSQEKQLRIEASSGCCPCKPAMNAGRDWLLRDFLLILGKIQCLTFSERHGTGDQLIRRLLTQTAVTLISRYG